MKIQFLISIALILGSNSFGQQSEIDKFCQAVDSSLINENIILYSVKHKTDFDNARYYDHYYIDTSKGLLVKSIYEFNFEGGEHLVFYYLDKEIIKIDAKHKSNQRRFAGSFYFKSQILIARTDGETNSGKDVFDVTQMLKTGNEYMNNSMEIIKSLKRKSL